jgi:hypothetical protein
VGAAVPVAVCRWGLRPRCAGVGRWRCLLAFTRYCFTSRLYCAIIFFTNTPFIAQYIAQYCHLFHPPAQFSGSLCVLEVVLEVFLSFFYFEFWRCRGVQEKNPSWHGNVTLLCNIPLPASLYCLQYCAICFPPNPPLLP